jgi:hypothetical protein
MTISQHLRGFIEVLRLGVDQYLEHLNFISKMPVIILGSAIYKNKKGDEKKLFIPLSAPDEIRTHIDGTGNHNSIR